MTFTGDSPPERIRRRRGAVTGMSNVDGSEPGPGLDEMLQIEASARHGEKVEVGGSSLELLRSLGQGGYAEVFLARRLGPDGFTRTVAVKCIHATREMKETDRRAFVYEARLASRLHHPNIAEAYDLALVGDRYHLVMEYVDGVTARAALRAAAELERRLSEGFCCYVAASVAEALHHAHALADDDGESLGIVHRDVTPVNVMLARTGAVKLLDFGVALARMEGREQTVTGQFKGTFVYASPEQIANNALDGRSDLFSLGVLLVEMLTGIRVFETESDFGTMQKIAECKREDVEAAVKTLSPELASVCVKALARRPEDRFQSGADFSKALREHLADQRITYWSSDCAAELRSLGLIEPGSSDEASASDASVARVPVGADPEDGSGETKSERERHGVTTPEPAFQRPRWRRWAIGAGALVAVATVGVWGAPKLLDRKQAREPAAPAAAVLPVPGRPAMLQTTTAASAPPLSSATSAPIVTGPQPLVQLTEPVVRPKQRAAAGQAATRQGATPATSGNRKERALVRASLGEFADRVTVASPRATLPRGTLVEAKLLGALNGKDRVNAEAIVTEEVTADGALLVPKGSKVSCLARPAADGRVPLSCDTISTSGGVLTFSGVAVGEGQHVGLRLLDEEIAAGTPFVVYVSAPAAVR